MSPHKPEQDSTGSITDVPARRPLVVLASKDEQERHAMRTILETWDLDITEANSCSEAPEVAGNVHPDLILLDVAIPFTESLEAAATLKNQPPTSGIPVLIISEFAQPPFRDAALAQGVAEYLTKPAASSSCTKRSCVWHAKHPASIRNDRAISIAHASVLTLSSR